jgi:hypothetical protein
MSNEQNVQPRIAAALVREQPLTFAECSSYLTDVVGALGAIGDRIAMITPGGNAGRTPVGVEYQRALQTGTAADVQALDEEFRDASTLLAQLQAQRDELSRRRSAAAQSEAHAALPALYASLDAALDAAEQAARAYDEAVAAVRAKTTEINQARGTIRAGGGLPEGGASMRAIRRVSGFIGQDPGWVLDTVGCAVSRDVVQTAYQKFPNADYSDCTSDIAVMRAGVATVHGVEVESWGDDEVLAKFGSAPFPVERIQHGRRAA